MYQMTPADDNELYVEWPGIVLETLIVKRGTHEPSLRMGRPARARMRAVNVGRLCGIELAV